MMSDEIPIIDLSALMKDEPAALETIAREIRTACERHGFFYIRGHGVSEAAIERIFDESARFFTQPFESKLKLKINRANRGYVAPGTSAQKISSVKSANRRNQYESLLIRDELAPGAPESVQGNPMHGPNQWPEDLPGFKEGCLAYYEKLMQLSRRFLPIFSIALGLPSEYLERYFRDPTTSLRLLHYPRQMQETEKNYGTAPHTDYGFLTILLQDDKGGLEIYDKTSREWIQAPPIPGTFVVNIGDALARWSNKRFVSTPHRVVSMTAERERYSVPFFFHLDVDAVIEALPTCISSENPPRYEPVRFGDYLAERLSANFAHARDNG